MQLNDTRPSQTVAPVADATEKHTLPDAREVLTVADLYAKLGPLERERIWNAVQDASKRQADPTGYKARDCEGIEFLALFVDDMQEAARALDSRAAHAAALQWQGITEEERERLFTAWETVVAVAAASKARGMRPIVPLPDKKGATAK